MGKPEERCGLAWTQDETSILRDIIAHGGKVAEAFDKIGRGEDAIKRKWRKLLANKTEGRSKQHFRPRHYQYSRNTSYKQSSTSPRTKLEIGITRRPPAVELISSASESGDFDTESSLSSCSNYSSLELESNSSVVQACANMCGSLSEPTASSSGAACDECRRRHKKCTHRARTKVAQCQVKELNSLGFPLQERAGRTSIIENAEEKSNHQDGSATALAYHKISPMTTNRQKVLVKMRESVQVESIIHDRKSQRVSMKSCFHMTPVTSEATINGKKRGRPYKERQDFKDCAAHEVKEQRTDATKSLPSRHKRRSVEDYEFSERFNKFVSGNLRAHNDQWWTPCYTMDTGLGSKFSAQPHDINHAAATGGSCQAQEHFRSLTIPARRVTISSLLNEDTQPPIHEKEQSLSTSKMCPRSDIAEESMLDDENNDLEVINSRYPVEFEETDRTQQSIHDIVVQRSNTRFPLLPPIDFGSTVNADYDDIRSTTCPPIRPSLCA